MLIEQWRRHYNTLIPQLGHTMFDETRSRWPEVGAEPPPTATDLDELAKEITELVAELNNARLKGFIRKVCKAASAKASGPSAAY